MRVRCQSAFLALLIAGAAVSAAAQSSRELYNRGAALIQAGRYSEAAAALLQAEKLAPGDAAIHHYLGYAYWKLDRWNAAEAEFQIARRLNPQNAYTLYFLARIAASTGNPKQAIGDYEALLKLGPPVYDTNQRLGQAYLDEGEFAKARVRIEAALNETPWEASLYYQLGRIDQKSARAAQARQEFVAADRLRHVNQSSIEQLLQLDVAVEKHNSAQVTALRQSFLANQAEDPEILDSVGVTLGRGGLYSDALAPLERAATLAPDSFQASYNLGYTLMKLGRADEAKAALGKALALEPQSLEVNRLLGILAVNENNNQEAITRLRAAHAASPEDGRVLALLGEQYLAGHYASDAITALTRAAQLQPGDYSIEYLLTQACERTNDYARALAIAQDAARRFPKEPRAIYEVGQQLANLGQYAEAKPYAEKALHMDSSMVYGWNLLGDINSRTGEYAAAVDAFNHAIALDPKDGMALSGAGAGLVRLGRLKEAVDELNRGVAANPEYADLYFNLIQAYSRLGQRDKARQAEAAFQKYHAAEVEARNAAQPRSYSNP